MYGDFMKKWSLNKIRISELLLSFLCIIIKISGLDELNVFFNYFIPITSLFIIFLAAYEFKFRRNYFRLIYLIVVINFAVQFTDNIYSINLLLFFFLLIYSLILLITIMFSKRIINISNKEKGKLPVGVFSKKHNVANIIVVSLFLISFAFSIYLDLFVLDNIFHFILLAFGLGSILIICVISINPLYKLNNLIVRDFKYYEFKKMIDEFKENNLHSDTYNYLLAFESNYTVLVDKKESIRIFEMSNRPISKQYEQIYDSIELCYLYNKEDKENFDFKFKLFKEKYPRNINNKVFEIYFDLKDKDKEIKDIEKIFNVNNKLNFNKYSYSYNLMEYYYIRGNVDKAKEYAKIIVDLNAREFKESYNHALLILNEK